MLVRTILLAAATACAVSTLQAQPLTPPKILQLGYETVKVNQGRLHENHETGWPLAFAGAKVQAYYFALTPMTGNRDVIYMSGYPSWAAFEATNEAIAKAPGLGAKIAALGEKDAQFLDNIRQLIAQHRPDGSIGQMDGPDYSKVRGWRITTTRVRIGFADEFMEFRRTLKAVYERAGVTRPSGLYQVVQGVNTPTFLAFRPFSSMAEFDEDSAATAKARAGMSAEEREKLDRLFQAAVLTSEVNTYNVAPKQSYMPASYAADAFWKSNPVFAAAAKPGATQAGAPKDKP